MAWQTAAAHDTRLGLWQADGSHPSEIGSYLTACIVYATVFRESPVGLPPSSGLSSEMARRLQELAREPSLLIVRAYTLTTLFQRRTRQGIAVTALYALPAVLPEVNAGPCTARGVPL